MDSQKQQLVEKLQASNNILVTVSSNPSVDQLAACIGLTLLLNKLDKHATAVFSGAIPSTIEFLKPEETLEKNTDSLRDFIIALDKSKADKLRYKVEDRVVKIFITPYKTSLSANDLEFSQGDFNVDTVVALGVHEQADLDQAITAHGRILHDAAVACVNLTPNGELGTINWVQEGASSLSELIVELSKSFDQPLLDAQVATALLTGIVAETDRFRNEKTSAATMNLSADLMNAGANQQLVASELDHELKLQGGEPAKDDSAPANPADGNDQPPKPDDGTLEIEHDGTSDVPQNTQPSTPSDGVGLPPADPKPNDDTQPQEEQPDQAKNAQPDAAIPLTPPVVPPVPPAAVPAPAPNEPSMELPKPPAGPEPEIYDEKPSGESAQLLQQLGNNAAGAKTDTPAPLPPTPPEVHKGRTLLTEPPILGSPLGANQAENGDELNMELPQSEPDGPLLTRGDPHDNPGAADNRPATTPPATAASQAPAQQSSVASEASQPVNPPADAPKPDGQSPEPSKPDTPQAAAPAGAPLPSEPVNPKPLEAPLPPQPQPSIAAAPASQPQPALGPLPPSPVPAPWDTLPPPASSTSTPVAPSMPPVFTPPTMSSAAQPLPPVQPTPPAVQPPAASPVFTPSPAPPAAGAPSAGHETLTELEASVDSPHVSTDAEVQSARDAVLKALNEQADTNLPPIQALNAQPLPLNKPADNSGPLPPPPPSKPVQPLPPNAPDAAPFNGSPADQPLNMPLPPTSSLTMPTPQLTPPTNSQVTDPNAPPPVPPPMTPPKFS